MRPIIIAIHPLCVRDSMLVGSLQPGCDFTVQLLIFALQDLRDFGAAGAEVGYEGLCVREELIQRLSCFNVCLTLHIYM